MTLIYSRISSLEQGLQVHAIGDVLLSRRAEGSARPFTLPTQARAKVFSTADWTPSGLRQKILIAADRTLLMWAGSYIVARTLMTQILQASKDGTELVDFPLIVRDSKLNDDELRSVSLIYIYVDDDELKEWHLNATQPNEKHGFFVHAGSGSWDFTDNSVVEEVTKSEDGYARLFFADTAKVIHTLVLETLTLSNLDFLYGGWLEVAVLEQGKFVKLPCAIKFWGKAEDRLHFEFPALFSWYEDDVLLVCRMDIIDRQPQFKVHVVDSTISLTKELETEVKWEPRLMCHVVLSETSEIVNVFITKDEPSKFSIEIIGEKTKISGSTELLDMLSGKKSGNHGFNFSVEKPFTDLSRY